jgi:Family of unknown function (DUF5677)
VDLPKGFEKQGFLSPIIANSVARLRADNKKWFELADDVNAALMCAAAVATATVRTKSWDPKAVAVRVLLRSCGTFQGVILLTERGMVAEGRTLARSLIESAFGVAALLKQGKPFIKMLKDDSEASRHRQRKFIVAEKLIAKNAALNKLNTAIIAADKPQGMNVKCVARLGPLNKQYLAYQRLSDDSAHLSARSLHRHVCPNAAGNGWNYKWAPGDRSENAATLHYAILAALGIGVGITQLLGDTDGNAVFGQIANRFHAMPSVGVV